MMYRTIWLVKRKPGTTHQQFRDYYESELRLLGEELINGFGLSYERYYLYPMTSDGAPPIYDAVTQLCFPDRDAYDRCTSGVRNDPEKARRLAEDQAKFLDHEACVHFEAQDSCSRLQPLAASGKIFRTIWFARRRSGMTHEECRAYYENKHRLLGEYLINGYAYNYDRHYLYKIAADAPDPHYTFIMEMNFQASDSMDQITANIVADPTIGKLIAEDEARFIDRDSAVHYAAELSASALQPIKQPRI
jgi:hypothetical protein